MLLRNKRLILGLVLGTFVLGSVAAEAQVRIPFKKKSKPQDEMQLSQSDGPWLIMCASFSGEQGMQQARQLATELRSEFKLDAFVYRHRFDHKDKIQGSGWQKPASEIGDPVMTPWNAASDDSYDQIAVLVGNFSELKDPNAARMLQALRKLNPKSMSQNAYMGTNQTMEQQYRARAGGGTPLAAAFIMPNPMLPPDFFKARDAEKVTKAIVKLNKGKKYSLLKCPGTYSVRVATFSGESDFNATAAQIQQAKRDDEFRKQNGQTLEKSKLMDAGLKANVLCLALRKSGVEAYQYHDRNESYVCVGSFDWATDPNSNQVTNGRQEMNPEMAEVINKYKANTQYIGGRPIVKAKTIKALKQYYIDFDAQPMPVQVPKMKRSGLSGLLGR